MNKLAFIVMLVVTVVVLFLIDFLTLLLVISACFYYRYLVVQNNQNKLSEFNSSVYKYFELIGKYAIIGLDAMISMFF